MFIPTLPTELWHDIASYLHQRSHYSLVLVNKRFHSIFLPILYSRIQIIGPSTRIVSSDAQAAAEIGSRYSLAGPRASAILDIMDSNESLRSWVHECSITNFWPRRRTPLLGFGKATTHSFEGLMSSIFTLVGKFPSLKTLSLYSVTVPATCILYAFTQQNQSLYISDNCVCYGETEVDPNTVFTVARFRPHSSSLQTPLIIQATLGGSLRELFLTHTENASLRRFLEAHINHGSITLPNLELLELAWTAQQYLPFFTMTPNLKELRFKTALKLDLGTSLLDSKAIPKLSRFSGHNSLLKTFTCGRPVTSIETNDTSGVVSVGFLGQDDNVLLTTLGHFFGAASNVKKVVWNNCSRNRELMEYLVQFNPEVGHLTLTPSTYYTKVRSAENNRGHSLIDSQEELHDRLGILKALKNLRTLNIYSLRHTPCEESLNWERTQCEYMQAEGCQLLTSISFTTIIQWHRLDLNSKWAPSGVGMDVYDIYRNPLPKSIRPLKPLDENTA